MHLHRTVIKEITHQDMTGTLSTMPIFKRKNGQDGGEPPSYGIIAWNYRKVLRGENDETQAGVGLEELENGEQNDMNSNISRSC